jgi:HlyD family secretion protein
MFIADRNCIMTDPEKNSSASPESALENKQKISGVGMDRKVAKSSTVWKKLAWIGIAAIVLSIMAYSTFFTNTGKAIKVDSQRIGISAVTQGTFEDFIPIRARVIPAKTVYLDAVEGGRIERILVEDGTQLNAGALIVELSNSSLQLSVLGNETRVAEQLNNMRTIELNLEQNRLLHKRNLVDINYEIKMLSRQLSREQALLRTGAVSQSVFADTKDTLNWYKDRLALTLESQSSDKALQESQLVFLKETAIRLESNLEISRLNLTNMNVRAPVDGKLSGFDFEVGQSIDKGERLGQIDTPNDFKLSAMIDEFYLSRVDIGQRVSFDEYQLSVSKIYPQVTNGQFEVDLQFTDEQPEGIRRGQTVQTKLTLGDESEALLIPNGAFYQDTGGNWIFVVTVDGSEAIRRPVRLGRRNSRFIEVLEGLEVGERVVTSPYTSYQDMQRLKLN